MGDDKYRRRKITISVKTVDIVAGASAAYDSAKSILSSVASSTPKDSKNVDDTHKTLQANNKSTRDKTVDTIVLPLPNNLSDSQDHGWNEETGIIGTIGANLMNSSVIGISADKGVAAASSSMGFRKPLVDPGYFQNYAGSSPRNFALAWDFVPNDAAESAAIMNIIMKLKQYSAPTSDGLGVSLLAPHYLKVEFGNKYVSSMINLDRVVIRNLTIDYGADGNMQQFHDGMPKQMSLSIQLQEVDMVTSNSYNSIPDKA